MGKAKRLKKERADAADALNAVALDVLANALRAACDTATEARGADCALYALVGARVLQHFGVAARAVAGHAAWRVGPGAGDVISHSEQTGGGYHGPLLGSGRAAMFHAWIEAGDTVLDFTTWLLPTKAADLDAADGQHTSVQWCPPFVCVRKRDTQPMRSVVNGYQPGLLCYARDERLERMALGPDARDDAAVSAVVVAALHAYHALRSGAAVKVVSFDSHGARTERAAECVNE